jgi:hypothetical protein
MTSAAAIALPAAIPSPVFDVPDADFQRRWQEWKARGRAHEQAARRRALVCAAVAAPVALAVLAAVALAG